jgi:hypothetical protein
VALSPSDSMRTAANTNTTSAIPPAVSKVVSLRTHRGGGWAAVATGARVAGGLGSSARLDDDNPATGRTPRVVTVARRGA